MASFDEENAFTYVKGPEFWQAWQCGPPVIAKDVPREWREAMPRKPSDNEAVYPAYKRMIMGCSQSVRILFLINLKAANDARQAAQAAVAAAEMGTQGAQGAYTAVALS